MQIESINKILIDIILPAYNPSLDWEQLLIDNYRNLRQGLKDEIELNLIIVNDGSSNSLDKGVEAIEKEISNVLFLDNKVNRGKGHALKTGIRHAKGDYIIYTDIDFPYQTSSMQNMVSALIENKADIIVGVRDKSYYKNIPPQRLRISKILKSLNKQLFRLPTADTQAGLKGMNKSVQDLFTNLKTNRYLIDLEFLKKAKKADHSFYLLDIKLREDAILTKMHLKTLLSELGSFIKILFS